MVDFDKKKILFIEEGMGFGGGMVSLYEIVINIKKYIPIIISHEKNSKYIENNFKNYKVYHLNAKFTYKHKYLFFKKIDRKYKSETIKFFLRKMYVYASFFYDKYLIYKISKIAKFEKIDLIHSNNTINPLHLAVARNISVPAVVYLRGHFDATGEDRNWNKYIAKLLAPTNKILKFATQQLMVEPSRIEIVHDSIDISSFDKFILKDNLRHKYGLQKDTILIGIFARIIPMKGHRELAIAVFKLLNSGYNVSCIFVGDESDGDLTYFNELKYFISESGFQKNFIFAGYQSNVIPFYKEVDIVVHPSIADEAFGRVIIEAWAAKKPVIASNIAASKEIIDDNVNGFIYPLDDIDILSEKISILYYDDTKRKDFGFQGYLKVKDRFESRSIAEKIEKIYFDLLCR